MQHEQEEEQQQQAGMVKRSEEGSDARIAHVFIQPSVGANVTWLLVKFNEVWGVPLGAAASSARRQWRHVFAC